MSTYDRFLDIVNSLPFKDIKHYYKKGVDYGIIDTLIYPFDYADTLIRLGYEPFPPLEVTHIFESPSLILPGLNKFVFYLYEIDGFTGCFRSVIPYVGSTLIYRHLSRYFINSAPFPVTSEPSQNLAPLCGEFTRENLTQFFKVRGWKLLSSIAALHISYPPYVIAVRTIARFVTSHATKEGYRPGIEDSWLTEITRLRGFEDFYAGIQARMLREVMFAAVSAGAFLIFMKFLQIVGADVHQAGPIERAIEYIGNSIGTQYASPFRNASDIMIINGTEIPLGNPPFITHFETCWDCISRLRKDFKWKHSGGGLFQGRIFQGPSLVKDGKLSPVDTFFGPFYFPVATSGYQDTPYLLSDFYKVWSSLGVQPGKNNIQDLASIVMKYKSEIDSPPKEQTSDGKPLQSTFLPISPFFTDNNNEMKLILTFALFTNPFFL